VSGRRRACDIPVFPKNSVRLVLQRLTPLGKARSSGQNNDFLNQGRFEPVRWSAECRPHGGRAFGRQNAQPGERKTARLGPKDQGFRQLDFVSHREAFVARNMSDGSVGSSVEIGMQKGSAAAGKSASKNGSAVAISVSVTSRGDDFHACPKNQRPRAHVVRHSLPTGFHGASGGKAVHPRLSKNPNRGIMWVDSRFVRSFSSCRRVEVLLRYSYELRMCRFYEHRWCKRFVFLFFTSTRFQKGAHDG